MVGVPTASHLPASAPISRGARRLAVIVPAVALALMLALRLWLKFEGPMPGDQWGLTHLDTATLPASLVDLGEFFSSIGTPVVASITVGCALPFVLRSDGLRGAAFVLVASVGVFFNMLLKELSGPTRLMAERTTDPDALNFPSGHTVYGVVVFGALAWLAWRHRRYDVAAPFVGLLLAMGPFRVVAETHFVSDVVAGYLVGIAWLVPAAILTGHAARVQRHPADPAPGPQEPLIQQT